MNNHRTLKEWYTDYLSYRESFGYKNMTYDFVRCFVNWCSKTYPENPFLNQEMLDIWCSKRPTENEESHGNRAFSLNKLLVFINARGEGPFKLYAGRREAVRAEPTLITPEQIRNFFIAVDELRVDGHDGNEKSLSLAYLRALEMPVFFRLQYSSGMRPNELRWLDKDDIDLENGVIYLHKTKGYIERMIALHPTMVNLMRVYDGKIREVMPNATPFFPNIWGSYHNSYWVRQNFNQLWYKYNPRPTDGTREVVSYALRHNYAIENIMNWNQDGYNADKRLVALSRSMGHVSIKSTQYYFHLVPRFADMLEDIEGAFVNEIIPEVEL